MNRFIKTIGLKSEYRVLVYAGLILLVSSCLMQYPFHLTEFNTVTDEWSYKQASDWLYAPDHLTVPLTLFSVARLFFKITD